MKRVMKRVMTNLSLGLLAWLAAIAKGHIAAGKLKGLAVRLPIVGFSHSPDVVLALARAGGFGVLGLARELPDDVSALLADLSAAD